MYVYIREVKRRADETNTWSYTVGFYAPNGEFEPESKHDHPERAASRVHYLNGGIKDGGQGGGTLIEIIKP